jgi:hypothetical protein
VSDIVVTVNADNPKFGSAPIMHSLEIGYKVRAQQPSDN